MSASHVRSRGASWPTSSDDIRILARAGVALMIVFFVFLLGWAAIAPLASAVIGDGTVKVETNRKSVQHLEGGIIKELRVKEGDRVEIGQILLVLDDTQVKAALNVLERQRDDLLAQEARLLAERDSAPEIRFPPSIAARSAQPDVAVMIGAQTNLFRKRRSSVFGQIGVLRQRIAQTEETIAGQRAQLDTRRYRVKSLRGEIEGLRTLFAQGYVPRERMLSLERDASEVEGLAGEAAAAIGRGQLEISETRLRMQQAETEYATQVATELRDAQAKLQELIPRVEAAEDTLRRTRIEAPYSGYVVGLAQFSVGGVINRGDRVLDIVPSADALAVEASIRVEEIEGLTNGMKAEVHLLAYKQRVTPVVRGKVANVGADRLTDAKTGLPYYTVLVRIDPGELERAGNLKLYAGMPAMVAIERKDRTALEFLVQPLFQSLSRAGRER